MSQPEPETPPPGDPPEERDADAAAAAPPDDDDDDDAETAAAPPPPPPAAAGPAPEPARSTRPDDAGASIPESVRQRLETYVPELVKRAFTAGLGAVFTTEEGIRRMTKEIPLPKDVAGYLVNTASSTKDELMRVMAREVREFLQNVNLSEEIAKMLTTLSFEVKTEIRFIPNAEKYGGVEPDVKASVRVKRGEGRVRRPRFRRARDDE